MNAILIWIAAVFGLFVGMLLCLEMGRRLGKRKLERESAEARAGLGAIDGAVFALLGLLIAFTFSGANNRFDERRNVVVEEANAIGTAWLRLDLLPQESRAQLQKLFREYLDSRVATYTLLPDQSAALAELGRANRLQAEIWDLAVPACRARSEVYVSSLLLPALNEMFDLATKRTLMSTRHTPLAVFILLFGAALCCAVLAGYSTAAAHQRSPLHLICFAAVIAAAVYVILDLEYPRLGLIRVDRADKVLIDLRESMK